MLPEKPLAWGRSRSCIRELAEYGAARRAEIGAENVFDFSLGNPSVPAPPEINEAIAALLREEPLSLHGYTTAAGILPLREKIAADLNARYGLQETPNLLYVTCGAASGLTASLNALLLPGENVVTPAPFFPEYRVFTEAAGGQLVTVPPRADFQPDLQAFDAALNENTKVVILNSPNNPSGVIYSAETLTALAQLLCRAEQRFGHPIYLISDEPYRELVYDGAEAPCPLCFYDDTVFCYSFSKSMSVPGERIGYVAVSSRMKNAVDVYAAIVGAARGLGYVNPPSLFQRVIERCYGKTSDLAAYVENRRLLTEGLAELGYEFVPPQGAFYLFVKALEPDAKAFSEKAKKHDLLLVPSDDFGCGGYVRIAYCVSAEQIRRSMPAFRALKEEYDRQG